MYVYKYSFSMPLNMLATYHTTKKIRIFFLSCARTLYLPFHLFHCLWFTFFQLLLAVGTKLGHVITELAHEVAEKHAAIEGDLVVQPSDDLFWFHRPHIVLFLIHFILFQNAFEIAFFFWIWVSKFF